MLRLKTGIYAKKPNNSLKPDFIATSVQDIDFDLLKRYGVKNCLVDLDDTVVERGKFLVGSEITQALNRSGLNIFIATNRPKSRDLKNLKESLGASGVIHPHGIMCKPSKAYFINGLKDMSLDKSTVVMIGDRYLQDIFGANRAGIYSLLVSKLGKPSGKLDTFISAIQLHYTARISKDYLSK